jgi:hypothetical protein
VLPFAAGAGRRGPRQAEKEEEGHPDDRIEWR